MSSNLTCKSLTAQQWLEYENFRHGIKERPNNSSATFTAFPEEYRPGAKAYPLPVYWLPVSECKVYQSHHPDPILTKRYFPQGYVQFPVHPVNLGNSLIPHIKQISKRAFSNYLVHPTSSTRTVCVDVPDDPLHCVKPHTDLFITRWRRHMEMRKVEHAIAITKILEESGDVFKKNPKLAYYPESLGAVYRGTSRKDWGFIIREMRSKPHLNHPVQLIPLNSLYTPDSRDPASKPLLLEMIKNSTKDPREFILEEILFPLLDGWIQLYLNTGILLEPHGQNVIVEIDPTTGEPIRFAHRDFDCDVNLDILRKAGFNEEGLYPKCTFTNEGNSFAPQGALISVVFDNSLRVVLEDFADLAEKYHRIPKESLRSACCIHLRDKFPALMNQHFPLNGKAYNYDKSGDQIRVVEKAQDPDWRFPPTRA